MDVQRYKDLLQRATLGFAYHEVVYDDKGLVCDYRFLEANEEFGRLTGLKPSEIIGKTVTEVIPGIANDKLDWIGIYGRLATEGGSYEFEGRSEPLGKWFLVKAISGERGFFSTIVYDITYYKEIERELSENEERMRLLLENSNDWVLVLDQDFRINYSTKLGTKILGMDIDLMRKLDIFSVIHPDDKQMVEQTITWLRKNPNKLTVLEVRVANTENVYSNLEVFASNMLDTPAINGYVINARDITDRVRALNELKEREDRLRHITDNITDVVFVSDKNLKTIYVSPSIRQLTGESPEEHMAKSMEQKHPPESLQIMQQVFLEELEKDKNPGIDPNRTRVIELQEYHSNGSLIDISLHVSMRRDQDGNFNGLHGVTRDVSYQKRVERTLQEKNTYIESMLGAIPDPIFVLDHQGRFTDLKAGNFEWLYVPEVEIHDRTLNEILPADIAEEIQKYIGIVLKNKKTQEFQYKIEVGGELRDYEARISYLDPEHVISLVRDITDQRRATRSVRQQNNFQKMVADISTAFVKSQVSSLDEIINRCLGQVGEFFEVQRAYIYRYSEDYAYLWKSNEWHCSNCQEVEPKREEYHVSMLPWWNKMILNGKTIKLEKIEDLLPEYQPEYTILTKQGIKSILCVPIQSGSRVLGYFGMDFLKEHRQFSDVDTDNFRVIANLLGEVFNKQVVEEHMKSQAQLQEIISRMAMKYINLPSENLEESINHSLRELATFSEADRAYIFDYEWGKGICISYNQWQREGLRTSVPMRKIMPTELIEPWPSIHRSGQAVSYEDVANADLPEPLKLIMEIQEVKSMVTLPLMNQGKCQGFVGFDYVSSKRRINKGEVTLLSLYAQLLVNVRNRRTLESRLIREKDRAEAANKAKSEFLANMSHEIRTPLNGVIGFAELLFNSGLDGAQHQYAKNIVNSSNNLLGILSDILDFSKIEAGKLELAPKKTDLIELVEHATDIIKIRMEQKNLELLLDVEPGLPRYAVIDPLRLNQILINLLSNAEKFTEQGEVVLQVDHHMTDSEHADLTFTVKDTGIGIDKSKQKKLFRAFSQLDSSTTRRYGGTGLGLVISNHLALLMGSSIRLESTLGHGSKFSVTVNCRVEWDEPFEDMRPNLKNVMVVDDNLTNLRIIQKYLEYWHLKPILLSSGKQALQTLGKDPQYDAIIIDYAMPELDGLGTICKIREMDYRIKSIPIILMHNSAEDSFLQNGCIELDIRYRLLKPVKMHSLYEQLYAIEHSDTKKKDIVKDPLVRTITKFHFDRAPQILIAEDNYLNMTLLKEMILQLFPQTEVQQASDGLQAVESVRKHKLDLVLMDVQMPNMDGVTASREIRKFSQIPIIAITAGALKEEQDRCLAAGMNAFLTKPVLAAELQDTLSQILEQVLQPVEVKHAPSAKQAERFNKEVLLSNISGDTETLNNLLDIARKTFPQKLSDLRQAIEQNDDKEIKSLLHSLKGSAQNMRFDGLGKLAADFEASLGGLDIDVRTKRFREMVEEWDEVRRIIT